MFHLRNSAVKLFLTKCFHTGRALGIQKVEEVRIPVPWGHIAGRWWGEQSKVPVIGLHGLLDNAATFDKLAPLLDTPSFLSLDLPGHGMSSHLPSGIVNHFLDNVVFLRYLLKNHFKWDKVTLLGHSFGGCLWFHYAGIFPDDVDKFISIDGATFAMAPNEHKAATQIRKIVEAHLVVEQKKESPPPEYSLEELVDVMYRTRKSLGLQVDMGVSREGCKTLMSRGAHKSHTGMYYMSRDLRLNARSLGRSPNSFLYAVSEQMKCQVLFIRASKGIIIDRWLQACEQSVQHMRRKSSRVEYVTLNGGHHLHLEHPQRVAPVVNRFLNS